MYYKHYLFFLIYLLLYRDNSNHNQFIKNTLGLRFNPASSQNGLNSLRDHSNNNVLCNRFNYFDLNFVPYLKNLEFQLKVFGFDAPELFRSQKYCNCDAPKLEILISRSSRAGNIELTTLRSRKFWNPVPETTKPQSRNWNSGKGSAECGGSHFK